MVLPRPVAARAPSILLGPPGPAAGNCGLEAPQDAAWGPPHSWPSVRLSLRPQFSAAVPLALVGGLEADKDLCLLSSILWECSSHSLLFTCWLQVLLASRPWIQAQCPLIQPLTTAPLRQSQNGHSGQEARQGALAETQAADCVGLN